jgi:hypothetical protein
MPQDGQNPPDTRPFLCVPYWTQPLSPGGPWDTGVERPLPKAVVSYACDSIRTSAYKPGQPLDVTVDVLNSGDGSTTALVTVVVYWGIPSVGFAKPTFFAAGVVPAPPSRTSATTVRSATMTATIPASAPDHVCLVVSVSHPTDKAGTVCDPVNDRHWAQRNLLAVPAAVGAPVILPIMAANPFATAMSFDLLAGQIDERVAHRIASAFQTAPSGIRGRMRLLDEHGAAVSADGERTSVSVDLGPLEERHFQVMIEIDSNIPAGQSAAVEVGLTDRGGARGLVGSLGVVLLPPAA